MPEDAGLCQLLVLIQLSFGYGNILVVVVQDAPSILLFQGAFRALVWSYEVVTTE